MKATSSSASSTASTPPLIPVVEWITEDRLKDAVNVILTLHNRGATYENNRGARWYELLNPSEGAA